MRGMKRSTRNFPFVWYINLRLERTLILDGFCVENFSPSHSSRKNIILRNCGEILIGNYGH